MPPAYRARPFQSTPPARGATRSPPEPRPAWSDFNPRPPRGGRLGEVLPLALAIYFNPRPPRGGRPLREGLVGSAHPIFQSTPPARGATSPSSEISSHFLAFQSTPPARGATSVSVACMVRSIISIHAPREGGDRHIGYKFLPPERNFNPRPPRGGRPDLHMIHDCFT